MIEGRVTGIADGAITGWIAGAEDCILEAVVEGGEAFGRARAAPAGDGRLRFAIPIPAALHDGRMRFMDVRPLGGARPLAGGPVIFDGGLLDPPTVPDESSAGGPSAPAIAVVDGLAEFEPPRRLSGWAWAPDQPSHRVRLEILAGGRLLVTVTAEKARADLQQAGVGDGRYGFEVDLARLLRRGPHQIQVRPVGSADCLPGGMFSAGPFAADGEVDCPGYLDDPAPRARLGALPLEHLACNARRIAPDRLAPRLINRLRRERLACAGETGQALLLRLPGEGPDLARETWDLQSWPAAAAASIPADPDEIRRLAGRAERVFFARPEDLIHPSAAFIAARLGDADAVSWNRFCADSARAGASGRVLRRPALDPATARHGALTDTTLALKGAVLAAAPGDVLAPLAAGRLHPLWFWLAGQALAWRHHPEALTSSVGWPPPARRDEWALDEAVYRRLLASEAAPFTLERTFPDLPFPYALLPVRRAGKTSVLISFRDRSALTLRCLYSVAAQKLSGELEVVLVDNGSDPAESAAVADGARRLLGEERVVRLSRPGPFSHSAQNNLAARAATGEVLVLCNNDVVLTDRTLLEQLGAWALRPGVGAVGCRLWDPDRGRGSYGLVRAAPSDDRFQPPLREGDDATFAGFVHAAAGATLALAAVSRARYLELGGLDEVRFPVGYNDIDFMLRASRAGLLHLYLGHAHAEHARGSSRTGDNEDLQALWLQEAAGSGAAQLFDLACERIETARAEPAHSAAGQVLPDAELLASLEAAAAARRDVEQRRAELAQAFARASGVVDQLGRELRSGQAVGG